MKNLELINSELEAVNQAIVSLELEKKACKETENYKSQDTAFIEAALRAQFPKGSWFPVGNPIPLKEIRKIAQPGLWENIDGDTATVIAIELSSGEEVLRISVPIKGGNSVELKLSSDSDLEEDDEVAIESITGQLYRKPGYNDLVKYDAVLIDPSFAAICTINSIKVVKYQQISAK